MIYTRRRTWLRLHFSGCQGFLLLGANYNIFCFRAAALSWYWWTFVPGNNIAEFVSRVSWKEARVVLWQKAAIVDCIDPTMRESFGRITNTAPGEALRGHVSHQTIVGTVRKVESCLDKIYIWSCYFKSCSKYSSWNLIGALGSALFATGST